MRSIKEIYNINKQWFRHYWEYEFTEYDKFDYSILSKIVYYHKSGRGTHESWNECFIMLDTETSKKHPDLIDENHVCAWTISIRAFDTNICTLYGHKPSECIDCCTMIHSALNGDITAIYVFNLGYDYWFLRQYMFDKWKYPVKQLNTNSLRPINIEFLNGIHLRDALILAQRSLDKWAQDLNVEHQKAVGKWDYDLIRNQDCTFTSDELEYIEHDTLAGVECLDATAHILNKKVYSMPFTATGIPREELRNISKKNRGRNWFKKQLLTAEQQLYAEECFHGGFTHCNRNIKKELIDMIFTDDELIKCKDFASSYPYAMMHKMPCERFSAWTSETESVENILKYSENLSFMLTLEASKIRLKDIDYPMPYLQHSKLVNSINTVCDNGRVIYADYVQITITDIDLSIIDELYEWEKAECFDIIFASKDYLPRWFTDYIWKCYSDKCTLKGGDPVQYAISKAKLNSLYGMCAQHPVKETWSEDYESATYKREQFDFETEYDKYSKKQTSFLPYQIGVFVTSIAARRLYDLSKCIRSDGCWLYTDTDSIYAYGWDEEKVDAFNEECKQFMIDRGYGCVNHNGKEFWLGIADDDGEYTEFIGIHAKCYSKRSTSGKLSITVAGVPKKGAECLMDDITNFKCGLIFPGTVTGKKQHTYFHKEMYIDKNGNETADSINLSACDYLLNDVKDMPIDMILSDEVTEQVYE